MRDAKKSLSILTVVQMVVFGGILIAALVLKWIGEPAYETVRGWYSEQLNDSVLANPAPESVVSSEWSSAFVSEPSFRLPESEPSSAPEAESSV